MERKESYIKEEFINEYGIKTVVMGIHPVDMEKQKLVHAELLSRACEIEPDGTFAVEDDSETGICMDCKEHTGIIRWYDAEGFEIEELSSCCGGSVHTS